MRKIITYVSLILLIAGVLGSIGTGIFQFIVRQNNVELPLIGIQGVVQKKDKIYIGNGTYRRIQIYDLKGNYIGFQNLDTVSQKFYFSVDDNGRCYAESNMIDNVVPSKYLCKESITYVIEKRIPLRIYCSTDDDNITIQQSIFTYLWFPLSWWIICGVGLIFFFLTNMTNLLEIGFSKDTKRIKYKRIFKEIL